MTGMIPNTLPSTPAATIPTIPVAADIVATAPKTRPRYLSSAPACNVLV
jgi:hypothetical protein